MVFKSLFNSFNIKNNFFQNVSLVYLHQFLQILIAIISVPIALSYFGAEQYGILAIVWTLITYLSLVNFGLPIALRVFLSAYQKINDRKKIFIMVFKLLIFLSCTFVILVILYPDSLVLLLFKIPEKLLTLASSTVFVSFLLYFLSIPFLIYIEGFAGIGMIGRVKLYEIVNIIFGFFALLAIVELNLSIYDFFLFRGIFTLIISLIGTFDLYCKIQNPNQIQINNPDQKSQKRFQLNLNTILKTSGLHFLTGISAILVWHTDNLIVNYFFGLEEVTRYSVTFRFVSTGFIFFTALTTVISPVYGLNFGNNNYFKINYLYRRTMLFIPIISGLVWLGALNFGPEIIEIWVGLEGNAGLNTILVLGGYGFCLSFVHSYLALIVAINLMKFIPLLGFIEAFINLIFSVIFAHYFGLVGVAMGTLLGGFFSAIILPIFILRQSDIKFSFDWKYTIFQIFLIIIPLILISVFLRKFEILFGLQLLISILIIMIFIIVSIIFLPKKDLNWLKFLLKKKFKIQ